MAQLSIGLDIGHQQVRAVALAPASSRDVRAGLRARVVALACVERRDHDGHIKPLAATLAEIDTVLGRRGAITAHLGDAQTLVRFVPTLPLPPDRRQRLLRLELFQHADDSGDLAADAWEVPLAGDELIHGCVIAQPAQILSALADMRVAGLSTPAISFVPAALYNAMPAGTANGDELHLIVDIGARTTGVTLFGDDRFLACRQLSIGGETFTEGLMATGLDQRAAEKQKRDGVVAEVAPNTATAVSATALTALSENEIAAPEREPSLESLFSEDSEDSGPQPDSEAPKPALPTKNNLSELLILDLDDHQASAPTPDSASVSASVSASGQLATADILAGLAGISDTPGSATISLGRKTLGPELQRTAEALYAQLASSLLWFKTQLKLEQLTLTKVHLVGGGAALDGLDQYLRRRFNAPVERFDPFARLAIADQLRPADPQAWAGAIGLALANKRLGVRGAVVLDVRPESLVRADFRRRHQIWPYVAAGLVVASTVVCGLVLMRQSGAQQENLAVYAAWKTKHDDLQKQLVAQDAEKEAQSEDLRAIASRIYAGRDLLYTVRSLKDQALRSKELWITRLETQGIGQDGSDNRMSNQAAAQAAKGYDTAIERGALLLSGKVKFDAASTDVGLDQFLKTWREAIATWQPAPDAPTLFLKQRVVEWDPNHKSTVKPGQKITEGEFPFKIEFTFRPTQLDQISSQRPETSQQPEPSQQPEASNRPEATTPQPAAQPPAGAR